MAAFNAIMFMMIIMVTQKPIFTLIKKEKLTLAIWMEGFYDIGHGMVNGAKNMVPIAVATGLAGDNRYIIPAIAAHLFVFYFGILADDTPPVGMAAYAAAGIAKSNPIKTGLQGFAYDIRTAILPFMFFFNNKLLLIKAVDPTDPNDASKWVWISNPVEIGIIFITAIIVMFAFSSATQGYFITKVNIFERLLFLMIVPLMFLPKIFQGILSLPNHYLVYLLGIGIYVFIYIMQKQKIKSTS